MRWCRGHFGSDTKNQRHGAISTTIQHDIILQNVTKNAHKVCFIVTGCGENRDPSSTLTASLVSPDTAWRCLDDDSRYAQLPDSLKQRLQSLLDDYLPLCEQEIGHNENG